MRALLGFYLAMSHALGGQRRLIRRIAGLCLVFMGVHLTADHLDDVAYSALDAVDLVVDNAVAGFLDWLAQAGGMSQQSALSAAQHFALFIDLPEKDKLALGLGLVAELLFDVMLFELAWGRHVDDDAGGLFAELGASVSQMKAALSPLDLERLAVIPTLFLYAGGGAAMAALAVEGAVRAFISEHWPDFLWGGHVAAAAGILAAALLIWRFVPDLLHGALLRSRARHDRAKERAEEKAKKPHRWPRVSAALALVSLHTRGLWLFVIALPLALASLMSHDLMALIERLEVVP